MKLEGIKFRVWDKRKKVMYTDVSFGDFDVWYFIEGGRDIDEDFEVMLYTTRKDKNGKDIYEGDIIKVELEDGYLIGIVYWDKVGFNTEVMINETNINIEYWDDINLLRFYLNELKVIGDVYQNPELPGEINE